MSTSMVPLSVLIVNLAWLFNVNKHRTNLQLDHLRDSLKKLSNKNSSSDASISNITLSDPADMLVPCQNSKRPFPCVESG
jgi:hypothetical protein